MAAISYEIKEDSYYLFACAELKEREKELISPARIERMITAADMEEFLKVLGETFYASDIAAVQSRNSFEEVMLSGYGDIIRYLDERLREEHKNIKFVLFFEEFLHNLKIILKALLLKKDLHDLYIPLDYSYKVVIDAYESGKYEEIGGLLPEMLEYIRELLAGDDQRNPRQLEFELESFYADIIFKAAESLDRRMITDYMKQKIDIMNIETIFRYRQLGAKDGFTGFLHGGGNLEVEFFTDLEDESMDYIVSRLEETEYADVAIRGAQKLSSDSSFSSFERNRDLYFLDFFDSIKYSITNLERVFQFFLKKKMELANINLIYTGIKFNSDKSILRGNID